MIICHQQVSVQCLLSCGLIAYLVCLIPSAIFPVLDFTTDGGLNPHLGAFDPLVPDNSYFSSVGFHKGWVFEPLFGGI